MITINGEKMDIKEIALLDLIAQRGYSIELIALELNGRIIPRERFEGLVLKDGDSAEIVCFVGGG